MQLGIKEVLDLNIYDFNTNGYANVPRFYTDYAKNIEIGAAGERLNLVGGRGNYFLLGFDHSKTTTMKMTLPLVDTEALSILVGKDVAVGAATAPKTEILTSATQIITLASTPLANTLKIFKVIGDIDYSTEQVAGTPASTENKYSIADSTTITLNSTTAPDGTKFICYYNYTTDADAEKITLTANNFPTYMRITGEGIATDKYSGNTYAVIFDIKKAKVKPNFTYTFAGDAATELVLEFDLYTIAVGSDKVYLDTIVIP